MFSYDIFGEILKLNIGVAQSDNIRLFELLNSICPIQIRKYKSGTEHNGFIVPHDWVVNRGLIISRKSGKVLFDGKTHTLAVASHSSSFRGIVTKEELEKHVFFSKDFPNAFIYHFRYSFRPWEKQWGFCIPYSIYSQWNEAEYEIQLDTELKETNMLVGEIFHQGKTDETILFNAHTCHPAQANDDMAGVMVILELFKWLETIQTQYSYKAVLAPEIIGTVFYANELSKKELSDIKCGFFVEMPGTEGSIELQKSFFGDSIIDRITEHVLKDIEPDYRVCSFREGPGNDETVWEAPGIEIPTISISRYPYREYHTSEDSLDIMKYEKLDKSLKILKNVIEIFEGDRKIKGKFTGLIALSNPKYDLYVQRFDPAIDSYLTDMDIKLGSLQDFLPRYFNNESTIFQIAEKFNIPFILLKKHIEKFEEKGLIELKSLESIDEYKL